MKKSNNSHSTARGRQRETERERKKKRTKEDKGETDGHETGRTKNTNEEKRRHRIRQSVDRRVGSEPFVCPMLSAELTQSALDIQAVLRRARLARAHPKFRIQPFR